MRDLMVRTLKAVVVPELRSREFQGTFPHFYRQVGTHVDLLCFQFARGGGAFVVEIAFADTERKNVYVFKDLPANKLRVAQTLKRRRLGSGSSAARSDHWYRFARESDTTQLEGAGSSPAELALLVREHLGDEADDWWQSMRSEC